MKNPNPNESETPAAVAGAAPCSADLKETLKQIEHVALCMMEGCNGIMFPSTDQLVSEYQKTIQKIQDLACKALTPPNDQAEPRAVNNPKI